MNSIREQEIKRFPPSLVNKTLSFFHIKSTKKEKKKLKKMLDLLPTDSDGETLASSQSSMSNGSSDRCSSLSRLSFDTSTILRSSSSSSSTSKALDLSLGPRDFKLIRKIGSGDIGTVYLCKLREEFPSPSPSPSPAMYAMKVVDREVLRRKKKMERAEIEKTILKLLRHPFLPTLYADFDASPCYSCVVTEFCSGGDLHSLRHRQPAQRFSLNAARFYAAEVLVALEYLHMLGVVYRDLKPENILIRSDGHIMLSDFDLSLLSTSSPSLHLAAAPASARVVPSCSPLLGPSRRNMKSRPPPVCFVAEPVGARSHSFVGTHEYVAPEVASGQAHGNGVDWWAYGVFVYELLYGRTPFVGPTNDATLKNIVKKPLSFPSATGSGPAELAPARDLIAGLLAKDPAARLGASRGAADVKAHPFFKGVKFALLRSSKPPFVSGLTRARSCKAESRPKPEPFDYF